MFLGSVCRRAWAKTQPLPCWRGRRPKRCERVKGFSSQPSRRLNECPNADGGSGQGEQGEQSVLWAYLNRRPGSPLRSRVIISPPMSSPMSRHRSHGYHKCPYGRSSSSKKVGCQQDCWHPTFNWSKPGTRQKPQCSSRGGELRRRMRCRLPEHLRPRGTTG